MSLKNIFVLASVLGLAWCQTPPGFKPAASNNLGVRFGKNITVDPGDKVRQNETADKPHLDVKSLVNNMNYYSSLSQTVASSFNFIVFMIDLDVPQNDTTVPFLHWYQPDVRVDTITGKLAFPKFSDRPYAEYRAPSPPPGPEHRYVEVLFHQPSHYELPLKFEKYLEDNSSARAGFDIREFVKEAGLKKPIAGSWFVVQHAEDDDEEL